MAIIGAVPGIRYVSTRVSTRDLACGVRQTGTAAAGVPPVGVGAGEGATLAPSEADAMVSHPITRLVHSPRNDDTRVLIRSRTSSFDPIARNHD